MGQKNAKRVQYKPQSNLTDSKDDVKQTVACLNFFATGDVVDHGTVDANGVFTLIDDNLTVVSRIPGTDEVILSASIDTSTVGTHALRNQEIDDAQEAIDRLYCDPPDHTPKFSLNEAIVGFELNSPAPGQTKFDVDDASHWRQGDVADVLADSGLVQAGVNVLSVTPNADDSNNKATIVIDALVDLTAETNSLLQATSVTLEDTIRRNQERIDEIDRPVENELMEGLNGDPDGADTCSEVSQLFKATSSKFMLDMSRRRLGTAGTRALLSQGAGTSQLDFTSMLLGLLGNEVEIEVQAGAGLTVSVTKSYQASSSQIISANTQYLIQVNDNGGVATSQDIADAINADADAKRIVQAIYGGDGTGVVAPFGPTALAGGLDDGTGDYAELEQVYENLNANTGYKFVSFHIRPAESNRMSEPPQDTEDLTIDYRVAMENVDR